MSEDVVLSIQGLEHTYLPDTLLATIALRGADLTVRRGEIAALVGPSAAGKSTLVRFLNGLLRPTGPGRVVVLGEDTCAPNLDVVGLRRRVGLVFQDASHQVFDRFVGDDIAYGPRQVGLPRAVIRERVVWAMGAVGLGFNSFVDRPTFALSGGELRRVALAGVLALRPEVLVLDEASTGLDPAGKAELHALLRRLRDGEGVTIVMVSNDMDEVASLADTVTVLHKGRTVLAGTPREVFQDGELLARYGLAPPAVWQMLCAIRDLGIELDDCAMTVDAAEEAIWRAMTA